MIKFHIELTCDSCRKGVSVNALDLLWNAGVVPEDWVIIESASGAARISLHFCSQDCCDEWQAAGADTAQVRTVK